MKTERCTFPHRRNIAKTWYGIAIEGSKETRAIFTRQKIKKGRSVVLLQETRNIKGGRLLTSFDRDTKSNKRWMKRMNATWKEYFRKGAKVTDVSLVHACYLQMPATFDVRLTLFQLSHATRVPLH
uniref:Uncharacterized protein n=1 Tax=Ditylum brightwellii TaxID=49249 RepID=A0A6S8UBR1_9STRA|mmetsp:Transcript_5293/g.7751  ORF Transcript_5293/g.7751 Transcript_5293/m.7751 type:complete len:126 (-) Transcript_5293:426-803(-)